MSIVKVTRYNIRCDRCGRLLDERTFHVSRTDLMDLAGAEEWITKGRQHVCPDCERWDDVPCALGVDFHRVFGELLRRQAPWSAAVPDNGKTYRKRTKPKNP